MLLKELNYEFISGFEFFIRNNALKENDPCTTNGTMKHLERLKKMVTWAVKNEWIDKDPFVKFRLKFKHTEREFLSDVELRPEQLITGIDKVRWIKTTRAKTEAGTGNLFG